MNKLMKSAVNSMNYFFLKETFSERNFVKEAHESGTFSGKGYDLYEALIDELSSFLSELVECWNDGVEEIIFCELYEGGYIDDLSIGEVEQKFKNSIKYLFEDEYVELLDKYMDVARKVKSKDIKNK